MFLLFIIITLIVNYFEGYWINQQHRDPRYAKLIKISYQQANSFWRSLLVLGGKKTDDVVREAAQMQITSLVFCVIYLVVYISLRLAHVDNCNTIIIVLFYVFFSFSLFFALGEELSYCRKKYVIYNNNYQECWISDVFEAFNITLEFKCIILEIVSLDECDSKLCSIMILRTERIVDNVLLSNNFKTAGDYATAIHYGDEHYKYRWVAR